MARTVVSFPLRGWVVCDDREDLIPLAIFPAGPDAHKHALEFTAAPDLLEVCKGIAESYGIDGSWYFKPSPLKKKLLDAIAKAERGIT